MVAYSFQKRFIQPIENRTKLFTIRALRAGRGRHARPGELLQLYFAMRTQHCRKIIGDQICSDVVSIAIHRPHRPDEITAIEFPKDNRPGREIVANLDAFARLDGFENISDMGAFWGKSHPETGVFNGSLICWANEGDSSYRNPFAESDGELAGMKI